MKNVVQMLKEFLHIFFCDLNVKTLLVVIFVIASGILFKLGYTSLMFLSISLAVLNYLHLLCLIWMVSRDK